MQFLKTIPLACVLATGLAACGGTTTPTATPTAMTPAPTPTPTPTPTPAPAPARTAASVLAQSVALGAPFADAVRTGSEFSRNNYPRDGLSATYTGHVGGTIETASCTTDRCRTGNFTPPPFPIAGTGFGGDLTLIAQFTAGNAQLTGSATNFVDENGDAATGTLNLTPSRFPNGGTSDPAINARLNGQLMANGQALNFNGALVGDFYGGTTGQPQAVIGVYQGSVSLAAGNDVELGQLGTLTDGGFIGTR